MVKSVITLTVEDEADVKGRLDHFLTANIPDYSRTRLKAMIEEKGVSVNGKAILTSSYKLKLGDIVEISVPEDKETAILPENIPLEILFEDEVMMVVNKPIGMVTHPAPGSYSGTLVNGLLHYLKDKLSSIGGVKRPGIVHRLDKDTSGLMVIAKTDEAHQHLSKQFSKRALSRKYLAVVWGTPIPSKGTIETMIGRDPKNRKKMTVLKAGGKTAITHYRILQNYKNSASLVECSLESGRTHQIRVHMSHLGFPLVGDPTYSANRRIVGKNDPEIRQILDNFPHQALHAYQISFHHPITHEQMSFQSNPPNDMTQLLETLDVLCSTNYLNSIVK